MSKDNGSVKAGSEFASAIGINRQEIHEKVAEALEGLDRGGGKDLAKNSADNLVNNVDKVEVLSETDKKGRLPGEEFGRKIFSALERMIQIAGDEAKMVIITNFNLQEYGNTSKSELSAFEREVERLESEISENEVARPDKEDFLLNAEVEFKRRQVELKVKHAQESSVTITPTKSKKGKAKRDDEEPSDEQKRSEDLEIELGELKDIIELHWKEKYLTELNFYQDYQKEAKLLEKKKKTMKSDQEKKLILNIHIQGILSAIGRMITKIKNAVQLNSRLKTILEGIIKIESTGERIHNPLETNNISGIYQALFDNFGKANFVSFTNDFLNTMSITIDAGIAKTDPMKAVQKVELSFGTWEVMSYWGYMSKDIFWTGILLNSFPKTAGEIREKLIFETNKFIRQFDNEERDASKGDMPIYEHLREYIKTIQDSQELTGKAKAETADDAKGQQQQQQHSKYGNSYSRPKSGGGNLETAAAASSPSENIQSAGTKFTGEVARAAGAMTYTDDGRRRVYTSTKHQCTECLRSKTVAGEKSSHLPQCFLGICGQCNNYGHKWCDCRQAPTSFRKQQGGGQESVKKEDAEESAKK